MATYSPVMGNPFASREGTVKKMLAKIGRDYSDLSLTAAAITGVPTVTDDPDIRMAFDCLTEVTAEVLSMFSLFNTVYYQALSYNGTDNSIAPAASTGYYLVPPNQDSTSSVSATLGELDGALANSIIAVKVLSQPSGMQLVYRGDPITTPRMFDNYSKTYGSFLGYGNVELAVTYYMLWEYIPHIFRAYIFVRAARRFVAHVLGAENAAVTQLREDEFAALGRAQAYDLEQSPVSLLDGPIGEVNDRWPW